MDNLDDRLIRIINEQTSSKILSLSEDLTLEDLQIDSIILISLIIKLEEEFNIKIFDFEILEENFINLKTLKNFIMNKIPGKVN